MTPSPTNNFRTFLPALALVACLATAAPGDDLDRRRRQRPGDQLHDDFGRDRGCPARRQDPGPPGDLRRERRGQQGRHDRGVERDDLPDDGARQPVPVRGLGHVRSHEHPLRPDLRDLGPHPRPAVAERRHDASACSTAPGTIVLDRVIIPNGGLFVSNSTDVFLEQVQVRHLQGELPPIPGVTITNSWVQANDLDATGGDLTTEPDFFASAGHALGSRTARSSPSRGRSSSEDSAAVRGSPARPLRRAEPPSTARPAASSRSSTTSAARATSSAARAACAASGPSSSIPSGNGGNAIEAVSAGTVINKKPMPLFGGAPGLNTVVGGPIGVFGAQSFTATRRHLRGDRRPARPLPPHLGERPRRVLHLLPSRRGAGLPGRDRGDAGHAAQHLPAVGPVRGREPVHGDRARDRDFRRARVRRLRLRRCRPAPCGRTSAPRSSFRPPTTWSTRCSSATRRRGSWGSERKPERPGPRPRPTARARPRLAVERATESVDA